MMERYSDDATRYVKTNPPFGAVACYQVGEDFPNGERAYLHAGIVDDWNAGLAWLKGKPVAPKIIYPALAEQEGGDD
jgi:hypothetical protein